MGITRVDLRLTFLTNVIGFQTIVESGRCHGAGNLSVGGDMGDGGW